MKLTIEKMKRGETPVRKLEKVFVNNTENKLDMFGRKMVKISWGGGIEA